MKKIYFVVIITLLMLIVFTPACGDNSKNTPENKNTDGNDELTMDTDISDNLPDFNFGGEVINILTGSELSIIHFDFVMEEITGERINDAILNATTEIEERFNFNLKQLEISHPEVPNSIRKNASAGDNAYDIAMIVDRFAVQLVSEGRYFYYLDELPYINPDKPYWDKSLNECVSINGKNYYALGACSLPTYDMMGFLVYNKDIHESHTLESVYQLVKNGKWTFDRFMEMARDVTDDITGDGNMTQDDRYGIITHSGFGYPSFWVVNRAFLVDKDENDIPYFNVPGNEKLFNIFDKVYELVTSSYEYSVSRNPIKNGHNDQFDPLIMFKDGHGLFATASAFTTQILNDMDADYGIVPYPALQEKQPGEPYLSRLSFTVPLIVPTTADAERGSVILEALSCVYYKYVVPEFRDITVQTKLTRDEESVEILEMLFANRVVDMGDTIWYNDIRLQYENLFTQRKDTFQALTESIQDKANRLIDTAIDAIVTAND